MYASELEIFTVIVDIYFLTYTYIYYLLKIEEHVAQEGEMREQPSGQEINVPTIPATETGKERYCNVNQNNELVISIIF
jgi:hypothetical protein